MAARRAGWLTHDPIERKNPHPRLASTLNPHLRRTGSFQHPAIWAGGSRESLASKWQKPAPKIMYWNAQATYPTPLHSDTVENCGVDDISTPSPLPSPRPDFLRIGSPRRAPRVVARPLREPQDAPAPTGFLGSSGRSALGKATRVFGTRGVGSTRVPGGRLGMPENNDGAAESSFVMCGNGKSAGPHMHPFDVKPTITASGEVFLAAAQTGARSQHRLAPACAVGGCEWHSTAHQEYPGGMLEANYHSRHVVPAGMAAQRTNNTLPLGERGTDDDMSFLPNNKRLVKMFHYDDKAAARRGHEHKAKLEHELTERRRTMVEEVTAKRSVFVHPAHNRNNPDVPRPNPMTGRATLAPGEAALLTRTGNSNPSSTHDKLGSFGCGAASHLRRPAQTSRTAKESPAKALRREINSIMGWEEPVRPQTARARTATGQAGEACVNWSRYLAAPGNSAAAAMCWEQAGKLGPESVTDVTYSSRRSDHKYLAENAARIDTGNVRPCPAVISEGKEEGWSAHKHPTAPGNTSCALRVNDAHARHQEVWQSDESASHPSIDRGHCGIVESAARPRTAAICGRDDGGTAFKRAAFKQALPADTSEETCPQTARVDSKSHTSLAGGYGASFAGEALLRSEAPMVRVVRGKHASSRLSKKRRQRQFQYMRAHASGAIVGTGSDNDAHAWQAVAAAAAADEVKIDLERGPLHDYYFARDREGEQVRTQSEPEQSPVKVLQLTGDGVVHDPKGHLKARKVRW